jgi:quinol monooxygenase YgiN
MIKRVVRMTFAPEKCEAFEELFLAYREKIRTTEGCLHLEWWQDVDEPNVYYTFSHWESVEALNNYKDTDTFKTVWPLTKALFAASPKAWSVKMK